MIAASGTQYGLFNLIIVVLAGTPLADQICERSQTTTERVPPAKTAVSTGIDTAECTLDEAPQYAPRREFLAKRELRA